MDENRVELAGSVSAVIYQNEENGYTVLRLDTDDGGTATVVGCLPFAVPGEQLLLEGTWSNHQTHGMQFKAESAERLMPSTINDIYLYLASGTIKGVGPATAKLIVERFGEDSLRIMDEEPERLEEIKGVTRKRAKEIGEEFRRQTSMRRLMEFFAQHDIKIEYALRLYKSYGADAQSAVMNNPYILADEYFGADFAEADSLALSLGFEADCPERVEAAATFELSHNANNGHTFIPRNKLAAVAAQLIGVSDETAVSAIDRLIDCGEIVCESLGGVEACYLSRLYYAETYVADKLRAMAAESYMEETSAERLIRDAESDMGITLAEGQRDAVRMAAVCGVMTLTGGPGTGKTTTVRAILKLFDKMGLTTLLAAPTGRAAKRMSELCGQEASTIHRLLETGYDTDLSALVFKRDNADPLDAHAVILDECSMIDVVLMQALLTALPPRCRLVLVGDADQLPSVGPGNMFSDVIRSGVIPTVRLNQVFRQAAESRIVRNAHLINEGEIPDFKENKGDFFFMRRRDSESAVETIIELCASRLPKNMGIEPGQIQVLSPTRLYGTGTANLNKRLQQALNPPHEDKPEKQFGDKVFRLGDRVMQVRNNYDIMWRKVTGETGTGIFNGDVGHICEMDVKNQFLIVDFDDRRAMYNFDMLGELEPAYAMTVHKSQGSEYRAVVLSLMKGASSLMSRAVLYTAVTRARELLIIVGDTEVVEGMVANNRPQKRYSGLRLRLISP